MRLTINIALLILSVTFGLYVCCSQSELYSSAQRRLNIKPYFSDHKDLFPMNENDIYGSLIMVVALFIAAASGIGGGGVLLPLFMIVFGFKPKAAIALSNFCILGNSVINIIVFAQRRHPLADRPLVDWDLLLIFEPLTIAGAVRK
jgi:hypothetical protein